MRLETPSPMGCSSRSGIARPSCSPDARRPQLHGYPPGFDEGEPPVTNHTDMVVGLWVNSWIVLLAVGVITWGLMIWAGDRLPPPQGPDRPARCSCATTCRSRSSTRSSRSSSCSASSPSRRATRPIDRERTTEDPDVQIEVIGKQWAWDFNYVERGRLLAPASRASGSDEGAERRARSGRAPDARTCRSARTSRSSSSRAMSSTRSGSSTSSTRRTCSRARRTTCRSSPTREGTYAGKCAELCGEYHSLMLFNVKVVSEAEYEDYIESLRDAGQTGQHRRRVRPPTEPAGHGRARAAKRTTDHGDDEHHDRTRLARRRCRPPGRAAQPTRRAQGQHPRQVDHLHRPQDHRVPLPDHRRSSSSARRRDGADHPRRSCSSPACEIVPTQRAVQPAVHDARHDHAADVRDAAVRRIRERDHAAADRRARRRVPAAERVRVLALPLRLD